MRIRLLVLMMKFELLLDIVCGVVLGVGVCGFGVDGGVLWWKNVVSGLLGLSMVKVGLLVCGLGVVVMMVMIVGL